MISTSLYANLLRMFSSNIRLSPLGNSAGGDGLNPHLTTHDIIIHGQSQHTGYAVAKAFILEFETKPVPERKVSPEEVSGELARLEQAAQELGAQFKSLIDSGEKSAPAALADSLGYLRESNSTMNKVRRLIRTENFCAEYAVQEVFDSFCLSIEALRDRAYEALDVKHRLLKLLYPAGSDITAQLREQLARISEPAVLFLEDLSPAQALQISAFHRKCGLLKGLVIQHTSNWGHQDLILRDLGLPVMGGIDFKPLADSGKLVPGEDVVLDVELGHLKLKLSSNSRVEAYRKGELLEAPEEVFLNSHAPRTYDGVQMELLGVLVNPAQLDELTKRGIRSIGLVRTELGVSESNRWLSEEEQYREYTGILQGVARAEKQRQEDSGKHQDGPKTSVSLRTYDFGSDKTPGFLKSRIDPTKMRGIRLMQALFGSELRTQARALLRAACEVKHTVGIIIPMVYNAGDMTAAREIFNQASNELVSNGVIPEHPQNVSIGAMIETAGSIATIESILAESDFISIGTSDLLQSILGGDGSKSRSAHHDPGFLFSVDKAIKFARLANKEAFVCGEMPCHSHNIPLLIGMGATKLVVDYPNVGKVNAMIAACNSEECTELVKRMIVCGNDTVAHQLRDAFLAKLNPIDKKQQR